MAVSAEDRKCIIDMYKNKASINSIVVKLHYSRVTVKKILVEEGIYDPSIRKAPKPPERPVLSRPNEWYTNKQNTAIKKIDILQERTSTKVGDVLYIRTDKGDRYADEDEDKNRFVGGALRKVTVVSTSNPRFCVVRFDSGVTEAVLWADIIKNKRKASENEKNKR